MKRGWFYLFTALTAATSLTGCQELNSFFPCDGYDTAYQTRLVTNGQLLSEVSSSSSSFPMALVLSQTAVNQLFAKLADTAIPTLSQDASLLGQSLEVSVRPSLPLLAVGGDSRCPACISASMPFSIGLGINGSSSSFGTGRLSAQLPIGIAADGDRRSALLARLEESDILQIDLTVGDAALDSYLDLVEPIAAALVTQYTRTRFANARVASFGSWTVGEGAVELAARGPIVRPESRTIVLAMQSNLPTSSGLAATLPSRLPEGAEMGVVVRLELLEALAKRIGSEEALGSTAQASGDAVEALGVTLESLRSSPTGGVATSAKLWKTDSYCGSADISAALSLSFDPNGVRFGVSDVAVTAGQGSGLLLSASQSLASTYMGRLATTLALGANYREVLGGEAGAAPAVETFRADLDAEGVSVYLNLLD